MSKGKQQRTKERKTMDEKIYKTFGERLRILLEEEYPRKNDTDKAFEILNRINPAKAALCLSRTDINDETRTIKTWMDGTSMPSSISIVLDICDLLHCEPGYLLGTQNEYHRGTIDSAKELGLDDRSIKLIKEYPQGIKTLLNKLILHCKGDNLLKLLQAIHTYAIEAQHSLIRLEAPGADIFETQVIENKLIGAIAKNGNTLPDISKKMLRYTASTTFDEILLYAYDDYIDEGNSLLRERIEKNADLKKNKWVHLKKESQWRELNFDEQIFLRFGKIGESVPSAEEAFKRIDKNAVSEYERYKNDIPAK